MKSIYYRQKIKIHLSIEFTSVIQTFKSRRRRSLGIITFDQDTFYSKVKENAKVGSTVVSLKATGGSGKFLYTKNTDTKSDRLFLIDTNTGEIKVREPLNREEGATQFTIDITATDTTNSNLIGSTTVVVTIEDVNDNAPIFSQSRYEKTIKEQQQAGRYVLAVQATDADEGSNKEIRYSIVEDGSYCPFKINPVSGFISNSAVLDRELEPYYVLTVKAEDQGANPLSSIAIC